MFRWNLFWKLSVFNHRFGPNRLILQLGTIIDDVFHGSVSEPSDLKCECAGGCMKINVVLDVKFVSIHVLTNKTKELIQFDIFHGWRWQKILLFIWFIFPSDDKVQNHRYNFGNFKLSPYQMKLDILLTKMKHIPWITPISRVLLWLTE